MEEDEMADVIRVSRNDRRRDMRAIRRWKLTDGYYWILTKGYDDKDKPNLHIAHFCLDGDMGQTARTFHVLGDTRDLHLNNVVRVVRRIPRPRI